MEAERSIQAGAGAISASGLDGVVVADTRLSEVDGERGRLIIAGRDVEQLAGEASFEEAAALLWGTEAGAARREIAIGRALAFERIGRLGDALERADGMDSLRASLAHLDPGDGFGAPARVTGAVATYAEAWGRGRAGGRPLR